MSRGRRPAWLIWTGWTGAVDRSPVCACLRAPDTHHALPLHTLVSRCPWDSGLTACPLAGVGAPEPAKRGHYALAAGEDPLPYLQAMAAMAGPLGLLPEQVWDATPPADAEHPAGRPTGAAMPLSWAHAELVKLQASRRLGRPFDRPTPVWRRYGGRPPAPTLAVWTPWAPIRTLWRGERLCVCLPEAGVVHWGRNGWREVRDVATVPAGFGLHRALLTDAGLGSGETVELTWRGELTGWSGQEVVIGVCEPGQ